MGEADGLGLRLDVLTDEICGLSTNDVLVMPRASAGVDAAELDNRLNVLMR